jgi:hypothetical protein
MGLTFFSTNYSQLNVNLSLFMELSRILKLAREDNSIRTYRKDSLMYRAHPLKS